jgi:hypothetical protein
MTWRCFEAASDLTLSDVRTQLRRSACGILLITENPSRQKVPRLFLYEFSSGDLCAGLPSHDERSADRSIIRSLPDSTCSIALSCVCGHASDCFCFSGFFSFFVTFAHASSPRLHCPVTYLYYIPASGLMGLRERIEARRACVFEMDWIRYHLVVFLERET